MCASLLNTVFVLPLKHRVSVHMHVSVCTVWCSSHRLIGMTQKSEGHGHRRQQVGHHRSITLATAGHYSLQGFSCHKQLVKVLGICFLCWSHVMAVYWRCWYSYSRTPTHAASERNSPDSNTTCTVFGGELGEKKGENCCTGTLKWLPGLCTRAKSSIKTKWMLSFLIELLEKLR